MKRISQSLVEALIRKAADSPRRRANHNFHDDAGAPFQRMMVAMKRDTYVRPHRHPDKIDFNIVIRGRFDVLLFSPDGTVLERVTAAPGGDTLGVEIPVNTFHTWIPLEDDSLFVETKLGPYDPKTASEFPPWAPAEDAPAAAAFLSRLRAARPGDSIA